MIYNIIVYDNSSNVTDVISFSSVTQFNESYQSEVTENTVEYGFKISDHIVTKSPEISIEGVVSDYSIYNDGLELYWNGSSFVNAISENGDSVAGNFWNVKQALIDLVQKRRLFTLILTESFVSNDNKSETAKSLDSIKIQKFVNCVMPNLTFPTKTGVYGALFVNLSVRQIRVARTVMEDFDKNSLQLVTPVVMTTKNGQPIGADGKPLGTDTGSKVSSVTKDQCDQGIVSQLKTQLGLIERASDVSQRLGAIDSSSYNNQVINGFKADYKSSKLSYCNDDKILSDPTNFQTVM